MALSEFQIRKAKQRDKLYRVTGGDGLNLLIQPNGTKSWQLRYRFLGKENILSFGKYPIISLAEARQKRNDAKKLIYDGIGPSAKRKMDKIAAKNAALETFGLVADDYLQQMEDNSASPASMAKNTWLLKKLAKPLELSPISDIHAAEILDILKHVEQSGSHAIIDKQKFGRLLNDIDDFDGWPTIKAALMFLALTCVRLGEVRGAKRDEFDLEKAIWQIPAEHMKMRSPYEVPLSKQAL